MNVAHHTWNSTSITLSAPVLSDSFVANGSRLAAIMTIGSNVPKVDVRPGLLYRERGGEYLSQKPFDSIGCMARGVRMDHIADFFSGCSDLVDCV